MLCSVSSIPGQTAGFSPFTEPLLKQLDLTRTQLSTCYFCGTLLSSFLLTHTGRWVDRYGARRVLCLNAFLFGCHLIFMSTLPELIASFDLDPNSTLKLVITMITLTVGLLFLRFLGQGCLPLLGSTLIGKWFTGKRGRASSVSAIVVGLAFSSAPSVMNELVVSFGDTRAWLCCAGFMFLILLPMSLIFCRDTPESCGIQVEGSSEKSSAEDAIEGVSPKEAKKTLIYWALILPMAIHAMAFTGFTFHLLGISAELGLNSRTTMAIFLPISVISLPLGFYFSRWSDTHSMKYLIVLMSISQVIGYGGGAFLDSSMGYGLAILGYGVTSAVFSPLFSLGMAKYFGRKYLGELQGNLSSVMVMSSSLGPLVLSLMRDTFGSFQPGLILFACLPFSVLFLLLKKS